MAVCPCARPLPEVHRGSPTDDKSQQMAMRELGKLAAARWIGPETRQQFQRRRLTDRLQLE
jgi:hypothetical protein